MTKKKSLLLLIVIFIAISLLLVKKYWFNEHADIDSIVIKNASVGPGTSSPFYKEDQALLVTDPKQIDQYKSLFFNNSQSLHSCGYTYDIQFWQNSSLYKEVPYNIECGEEFLFDNDKITNFMQTVHRQFQSHSDASLYTLKVPVTEDPQPFIEQLKSDGFKVLIEKDLRLRFPIVQVEYQYDGIDDANTEKQAKKQANALLKELYYDHFSIIDIDPFYIYSSTYAKGHAWFKLKGRVYLSHNADINQMIDYIEESDLNVINKNIPLYYQLTLIDAREMSEMQQQISALCEDCILDTGR